MPEWGERRTLDGYARPPYAVSLPPDASKRDVAQRLARLVGPMFGVVDRSAPWGMSWICDYEAVTIGDLARGAVSPTRDGRDEVRARSGQSPSDKAILSATLQRFGPDTKSAMVLTAANELFGEITADVNWTLATIRNHVESSASPHPSLLVAAWAYATLSVCCDQPLLAISAMKARSIQRAVTPPWDFALLQVGGEAGNAHPFVPVGAGAPARSELGYPDRRDTDVAPVEFDLIDTTVLELKSLLRIGEDFPGDESELYYGAGQRRAAERLAGMWCEILLGLGMDDSLAPALLWASERERGFRTIESYIPPTPLMGSLLHEQGVVPRPDLDDPDPEQILFTVPEIDVKRTPLRQRQLLLDTLCGVARMQRAEMTERSRAWDTNNKFIAALGSTASDWLPPGDPIRLLVESFSHNVALREAVDGKDPLEVAPLLSALDTVRHGLNDGKYDTSLGLYVIEHGCVLLGLLLRDVEPTRIPDVSSKELRRKLAEFWGVHADLLQGQIGAQPGASAAGYHLHSYAAYLSGLTDDIGALERSVSYFRDYVLPSREQRFRDTLLSGHYRNSLQWAARAQAALAELHLKRGSIDLARRIAAEARELARSALDDRSVRGVLHNTTRAKVGLVLSTVEPILLSFELGSEFDLGDDPKREKDLRLARSALDAALETPDQLRPKQEDALRALRRRLEALETGP